MRTTFCRTVTAALAAGVLGLAAFGPAAAAPPDSALPLRDAQEIVTPPAPLLHALPEPLACLVTTGFALFCLGVA